MSHKFIFCKIIVATDFFFVVNTTVFFTIKFHISAVMNMIRKNVLGNCENLTSEEEKVNCHF